MRTSLVALVVLGLAAAAQARFYRRNSPPRPSAPGTERVAVDPEFERPPPGWVMDKGFGEPVNQDRLVDQGFERPPPDWVMDEGFGNPHNKDRVRPAVDPPRYRPSPPGYRHGHRVGSSRIGVDPGQPRAPGGNAERIGRPGQYRNEGEEVDPDFGRDHVDPKYGRPRPVDPGYGRDPVVDPGYEHARRLVDPKYGVDPPLVDPKYGVDPPVVDPGYEHSRRVVDPIYGVDPPLVDQKYGVDPPLVDPGYEVDPPRVDPGYEHPPPARRSRGRY